MEDDTRKVDNVTLEDLQRDSPIKAYIANAEEYENGNLIGIWQPLPTTRNEFNRTLDAIGVKNGEYIADDFETTIPGLEKYLSVSFDIDELNYLAVKLAGMAEPEREIFGAVMLSGRHCGSVSDIINVTENLYLFDVQPAYSVEIFGEYLLDRYKDEYADVFKSLETADYPEEYLYARYIERLEKHVDPVAFGRSVAEEENGVFTDCGYLTEKDAFKECYKEIYTEITGVPPEYRVSAPPEREPAARPSVMDKLASAKEAAARTGAEKSDTPKKSHHAEL